jgi:hypothetical protein
MALGLNPVRIRRGRNALETYIKAKNKELGDDGHDQEDNLTDLITDLLHYANSMKLKNPGPLGIVAQAIGTYEDEVLGGGGD